MASDAVLLPAAGLLIRLGILYPSIAQQSSASPTTGEPNSTGLLKVAAATGK